MKKNLFLGFSLIELLISLIIISLIISAFMPILSNRLKHREVALGGSKIETKCSEKFNEKCMMCNDTSCILCTNSFSCPFGQYCDAEDDCKCKSCSAIYPNCTKCNKNYCESCIEGYKVKNGRCEKIICEAGYELKGSTCTAIETKPLCSGILLYVANKKICITPKNAGDGSDTPNIDPLKTQGLLEIVSNGTTCASSQKACCWRGKTAGACTAQDTISTLEISSGAKNFDYDGCNRTLCNKKAAILICQNYETSSNTKGKWRLPSKTEAAAIRDLIKSESKTNSNIQKYKGASGIQLCDQMTAAKGSAKCAYGTCKGAPDNICLPDEVWTDAAYTLRVYNGTSDLFSRSASNAAGVRCVLDME